MFDFIKKFLPHGAEETPEHAHARLEQEQAALVLSHGGILPRTEARLKRHKAEDGFSSSFSPGELLVCRSHGIEPVGLVVGSSFTGFTWKSMQPQASALERDWSLVDGRDRALRRMQQEALALGAHGVIDVKFEPNEFEWVSNTKEHCAVGTAVRIAGRPDGELPFVATLSATAFVRLYESGFWPVGMAFGSANTSRQRLDIQSYILLYDAWNQKRANQEVRGLGELVDRIKCEAFATLEANGALLKGDYLVQVTCESDLETEHDAEKSSVWATVYALTSGIVIRREGPPRKARTVGWMLPLGT